MGECDNFPLYYVLFMISIANSMQWKAANDVTPSNMFPCPLQHLGGTHQCSFRRVGAFTPFGSWLAPLRVATIVYSDYNSFGILHIFLLTNHLQLCTLSGRGHIPHPHPSFTCTFIYLSYALTTILQIAAYLVYIYRYHTIACKYTN